MRRHAGANLAGDENGEGLGAVTAGHVILYDVLESGERRKLDVQLLAKFVASFVYVARSQNPNGKQLLFDADIFTFNFEAGMG